MAPDRFTSGKVAGMLDIKVGQLNEWVRRGIIRPSVRVSSKQGCPALWSTADIERLRRLIAVRDQWGDLGETLTPALAALALARPRSYVVAGRDRAVAIAAHARLIDAVRRVGSPAVVLPVT